MREGETLAVGQPLVRVSVPCKETLPEPGSSALTFNPALGGRDRRASAGLVYTGGSKQPRLRSETLSQVKSDRKRGVGKEMLFYAALNIPS